MKKKINKKNVPAYAFGMDQLPNYLGGANVLGSAISGLSGEGSTGDAIGSTLGSAASLAGTGFSIGGPIGAAAGGVLGAAFGWIGSRRRKKQMEQMRRRKETMNKTQLGMNAAANQTAEYWDDNELAYTYENGGILPDLAYVDNNEIIRGDDGTIMQVPNNRPGTDNHLIDASNLESVLSDKIKRPGTNKTFAQEGKKLTRMTKPSKGKDIFADNTNMLNKRNANFAYDNLLSEQEEVKAKKGIKPKKKGIPAYEDGTKKYKSVLDDLPTFWNTPYDVNISRTSTTPELNFLNGQTPAGRLPLLPMPKKESINLHNLQVTDQKSNVTGKTVAKKSSKQLPDLPTIDIDKMIQDHMNKLGTKVPEETSYVPTIPTSIVDEEPEWVTPEKKDVTNNKIDYSPDWLSLAPTVYNALQSLRNPEYEQTVLNPYTGAITNTMARRRMNIEPARLANSRSRAISNYNLANINANTGANLAARTQAAVDEYAANANMYATKQNADNAYLGEYANTLNNLGQQFVQSRTLANYLNAKNRAAARSFGTAAVSQLGQWSQVNRQMKNQAARDNMIYPYLANFLAYGNPTELIQQMNRQYYKK